MLEIYEYLVLINIKVVYLGLKIMNIISLNGSPGEIQTSVGGSKALYPCPLNDQVTYDF